MPVEGTEIKQSYFKLYLYKIKKHWYRWGCGAVAERLLLTLEIRGANPDNENEIF